MHLRLSRRDFLKYVGAMAGGGALAACAPPVREQPTAEPALPARPFVCATPTPIPVPPPTRVDTNYDIYAWYLQGRGIPSPDPRTQYGYATVVPLYGETQNLHTMQIDMKWALEHGVRTFVMPVIEMGGSWEQRIDDLVLPASAPPFDINYALFFNPPIPDIDDYSLPDGAKRVARVLNAHLPHPRYKRMPDGRPVVFYFMAAVLTYLLGADKVAESADILRRALDEDVFLIGDAMCEVTASLYDDPHWTKPGTVKTLVKSFDALTSYYMWRSGYEWHSEYEYRHVVTSFESMIKGYDESCKVWAENADRYGSKLAPPISPAGVSNRLLYEAAHDDWLVDRHEGVTYETARAMAEIGAKYADPDLKAIVIGAWNECNEGAAVVPSKGFRFGPVHAVRDTFAIEPSGGWPEDYYPPLDL